jgi:L-alanine-DL-glutamate epimerase-like enolase superfamily enzyme
LKLPAMPSAAPVVDTVDFFYVAMPEVSLDVDGSQDALLVRVRSGNDEGWGECEAAPLPSIAAFYCPPSHGACLPVADSVLGARLCEPGDVEAIYRAARVTSERLAQAVHVLSGVEIACWDLLGKRLQEPVWALLGQQRSLPKTPYASLLFGDTPAQTLDKARHAAAAGYRAVKFGWGSFGQGRAQDAEQLAAAREGLGADGLLLIDAGCVWRGETAVDDAAERADALQATRAHWLEEPFAHHDRAAYRGLAARCPQLAVASGESAVNEEDALSLMVDGGLKFLQIDAGSIGGIGASRRLALAARATGCQFVNHTFTSDLALAASLAAFADDDADKLAEYPAELSELGVTIAGRDIVPDERGEISIPAQPGLGVTVATQALARYQRAVEIAVDGRTLYRSPAIDDGQPG